MSAIGASVMLAVNIIFVPKAGYMACAWGGFAGYGVAMLLSYFIGQRYYPVPYDIKKMSLFVVSGALIYIAYEGIRAKCPLALALTVGTLLLGLYVLLIYKEIKVKHHTVK